RSFSRHDFLGRPACDPPSLRRNVHSLWYHGADRSTPMRAVQTRLPYEETCRRLQNLGFLELGPVPPLPERRPRFDDEALGLSFFRTRVEGLAIENASLPR